MLGENYKRHKKNTLNIYKAYKDYRGNINDGVDIKYLQNRIDTLASNKFTLAVAGEVKAGKSTFLNALLRQELLPIDVLQATNAVIEICKSDENFLSVTYADGSQEEFIDNCKQRLEEICSVSDEYRVIPCTQINAYIQNSENLFFKDLNLELLEQTSGISKFKLVENQTLIEKYIKETPKNRLPISIKLGFPLQWDFDELRLVDCPGINATGGIQDLSYNYFTNANAIIFVHSIKPVESKSFREFVTEIIPDKNRNNLFLVLTHSDHYDDEEVERLTSEAKRLYGDYINHEHILAVDSIVSLIHSDIENGIPVKTIRQKSKQKKRVIDDYHEVAENEGKELNNVLKNASGFEKMYEVLEEYSLRAPNFQLEEILNSINKGYAELEKILDNKAKLLEQKKKSPQSFSEEIESQKEKLDEYNNLLSYGKRELTSKYVGVTTKYYKAVDDTRSHYNKQIRESNSIVFIRKSIIDGLDAFKDILNDFINDITTDLQARMNSIAKDFQSRHSFTVPKIDLKAIEKKATENAFIIKDIFKERDVDVWDVVSVGIARIFREKQVKVGEKKVLDNEKLLQGVKDEIHQNFQKIRDDFVKESQKMLDEYLADYKTEFDNVISKQKESLSELKARKYSNDEIMTEIKSIKKKILEIPRETKSVQEIVNDIT